MKSVLSVTYSTEHWQLLLPAEWVYEAEDSSLPYFKAPDSQCGIYIKVIADSTQHNISNDDEWLKSIVSIHKKHLLGMPGQSFEVLGERKCLKKNLMPEYLLEGYDNAARYRIACHFLMASTKCVVISYHDYWCESISISRRKETRILSKFHVLV